MVVLVLVLVMVLVLVLLLVVVVVLLLLLLLAARTVGQSGNNGRENGGWWAKLLAPTIHFQRGRDGLRNNDA